MKNNNLFLFDSPFIFSCNVKNHNKIKELYLPKILEFENNNKDNPKYKWKTYSNYDWNSSTSVVENYNIFFDDYFIKNVVWDSLDSLFSSYDYFNGFDSKKSELQRLWWNVYCKNGFSELHHHGTGSISGVYILELNETNTTSFIHRNEIGHHRHVANYAIEGTVLLFPSLLEHYTLPISGDRRVTISFDVYCGKYLTSWWAKSIGEKTNIKL